MSEAVKISLIDAVTNGAYETFLNAEDFEKVQKDMNFATSLLEMLKKCQAASVRATPECTAVSNEVPVAAGTSSLQDNMDLDTDAVLEHIPEEEHSSELETNNVGTRSWVQQEILDLIEIYQKYKDDFTSGRFTQKLVWAKVATDMQQKGHKVNGYNCNVKFQSLKRTYKSVKDHNSKSGNGPRKWNYYKHMDALFDKMPWVALLATASSTDGDASQTREQSTEALQKPDARKRKGSIMDYLRDTMAEKKDATNS